MKSYININIGLDHFEEIKLELGDSVSKILNSDSEFAYFMSNNITAIKYSSIVLIKYKNDKFLYMDNVLEKDKIYNYDDFVEKFHFRVMGFDEHDIGKIYFSSPNDSFNAMLNRNNLNLCNRSFDSFCIYDKLNIHIFSDEKTIFLADLQKIDIDKNRLEKIKWFEDSENICPLQKKTTSIQQVNNILKRIKDSKYSLLFTKYRLTYILDKCEIEIEDDIITDINKNIFICMNDKNEYMVILSNNFEFTFFILSDDSITIFASTEGDNTNKYILYNGNTEYDYSVNLNLNYAQDKNEIMKYLNYFKFFNYDIKLIFNEDYHLCKNYEEINNIDRKYIVEKSMLEDLREAHIGNNKIIGLTSANLYWKEINPDTDIIGRKDILEKYAIVKASLSQERDYKLLG